MDQIDNEGATAQELVSFAQQQGCDLEPLCNDGTFQKDQRWIFLWRKDDLFHYNMQGIIEKLPNALKNSASAFRGAWTEAGTFENIEQAFAFLKAWLVHRKEVDDLPNRRVRRYGI